MRKLILSALLTFGLMAWSLSPAAVQGQISFDPDDVFISELADSDNDFSAAYIEIYNNSDTDIDLRAEGGKIVKVRADGSIETVFDFDDNLDEGSGVVPANGILIVPRGASLSDFENEWGSLPPGVNYNGGSGSIFVGTGTERQWRLRAGGTQNQDDGELIDDTEQPTAGSGFRTFQETPGNWVYNDDQANATPGELDAGQVLPVELATFTAQLSGDRAQLQWETVSETSNAGFDIQHQAPQSSSFSSLGFVEGEGTTDEPQSYRFTTDALEAGTHTFRLRQVDLDGTEEIHEPITVEVQQGEALRLAGPHPVSAGATTDITVQLDRTDDVTVALYNVLGQRVETLHQGQLVDGEVARLSLDTSRLASGTYFLRLQGSSVTQTERVTVVR